MTDILNLQVKDEVVNNIISNNPFYVDIKGSVNICLIRCGQEIDTCNSVNFSTMSNYGKILVLNPNEKNISKCNIKMAFDTTNDNVNDKGDGNYKFERVFFTVPSMHKLNGQIFDMETFIVFSSIQKNGNILYVCLCSLSNGVNIVQSGDWKLLNYKLLNELFTKNNVVPEIFGTSEITGVPNPIDINNFIPQAGFRNFYDYTHPSNTKVNFRIYQTPLAVSNDVLTVLKSKLTPGKVYENFKNGIMKAINPHEGLFFYFSEDLTNRYKSLEVNKPVDEIAIEPIVEHGKDHVEPIVDHVPEHVEEEEEKNDLKNKNAEEFKTGDPPHIESNQSLMIIFYIMSFLVIVNIVFYMRIINFFTPNTNLDDEDLSKNLNELYYNSSLSQILHSRFLYIFILILHCIATFIGMGLLFTYMSSENKSQNIYNAIYWIILLTFFFGLIMITLICMYIYRRIKNLYDDDFSQKENYLATYIFTEIFKKDILSNLFSSLKGKFTSLVKFKVQFGGDGNNNIVPAPDESNESTDLFIQKQQFDKLGITSIFSSEQSVWPIIIQKFNENKTWKYNLYVLVGIIITFFIIGSLFQLKYMSLNKNLGIKININMIIIIFIYAPLILILFISSYAVYHLTNYSKYFFGSMLFLLASLLTISLFIPLASHYNKKTYNIAYTICLIIIVGLIFVSVLAIFGYKYLISKTSSGGLFGISSSATTSTSVTSATAATAATAAKLQKNIENKDIEIANKDIIILQKMAEVARLKQMDDLLKRDILNKDDKIHNLDDKLIQTQKSLEFDKDALDELTDTKILLQKALSNKNINTETYKAQKNAAEKELEKLRSDNSHQKTYKLQEQIESLQDNIDDLQEQYILSQKALSNKNINTETYKAQTAVAKATLEKAQQELLTLKSEDSQQKTFRLQEQIELLQNNRNGIQEQYLLSQQALSNKNQEISKLSSHPPISTITNHNEIHRLQEQIETLQSNRNGIQEQYLLSQQALSNKNQEISKLSSQPPITNHNEIHRLQEQIETLQSNRDDIQEQYLLSQRALSNKNQEISKLSSQPPISTITNQNEIRRLQEQIELLHANRDDLQEQYLLSQRALSNKNQEINKLSSLPPPPVVRNNNEIRRLQEQIESLQANKDDQEDQYLSLQRALSNKNQKMQNFKTSLPNTSRNKETIETLQQEIERLQTNEVYNKYFELQKELQNKNRKVKNMNTNKTKQNIKINRLQRAVNNLSSTESILRNQLNTTTSNKISLESYVGTLQELLKDSRLEHILEGPTFMSYLLQLINNLYGIIGERSRQLQLEKAQNQLQHLQNPPQHVFINQQIRDLFNRIRGDITRHLQQIIAAIPP